MKLLSSKNMHERNFNKISSQKVRKTKKSVPLASAAEVAAAASLCTYEMSTPLPLLPTSRLQKLFLRKIYCLVPILHREWGTSNTTASMPASKHHKGFEAFANNLCSNEKVLYKLSSDFFEAFQRNLKTAWLGIPQPTYLPTYLPTYSKLKWWWKSITDRHLTITTQSLHITWGADQW